MSTTDILAINDSPFPCFVNGELTTTKKTFNLTDPHENSRTLREVYCVDPEESAKAIDLAAEALVGGSGLLLHLLASPPTVMNVMPTMFNVLDAEWRNTTIDRRRRIILKAAAILHERMGEFVKIMVEETTSMESFAARNVLLAIGHLEELAGSVSSALAGSVVQCDFPGQTAHISREPYGVVLAIVPWNAPLILATRACATPIIAGNTCVLKTSEFSPVSNTIIAQVFAEAGLPKGVLNVIHVDAKDSPKVVESMIANPLIRKVNFTGSTRVGSIIGSLCGKHIKPVVLELGGTAVFIVLEDADIEHAAKNAVYGSFCHSGQTCMSTNNILVHESVAGQFVQAIQKEMLSVRAGSSVNPEDNRIRGVFTDAHASRVVTLVKDALEKGARVVVGDPNQAGKYEGGNVIQPFVLDHVGPEMTMSSQEIFGPAVGITRFSTDAEAIRIVNKLECGLSGAVHSRDVTRAVKVAQQLEINLVHINSFTLHDNAAVPHGGWKNSGFGRFNSIEGIREFTQTKAITFMDPSTMAPTPQLG